jgi:hypothetical protein
MDALFQEAIAHGWPMWALLGWCGAMFYALIGGAYYRILGPHEPCDPGWSETRRKHRFTCGQRDGSDVRLRCPNCEERFWSKWVAGAWVFSLAAILLWCLGRAVVFPIVLVTRHAAGLGPTTKGGDSDGIPTR